MRPPARAVVGNLVWSIDGGVWAVWSVSPFSHANTSMQEKLSVHSRIRGMLVSLPTESMLLSVCERLEPGNVVERMVDGVDLDQHPSWAGICEASGHWLSEVSLRRRRYYVAAALPTDGRGWRKVLSELMVDVERRFGIAPPAIGQEELNLRQRQAREAQLRLAQHVSLTPVSAGELSWLYARAFRRGTPSEPPLDERWEPARHAGHDRGQNGAGADIGRPQHVLAHLTDVIVREGGDREDKDRPRHRRYVRIDSGPTSAYQTALAMADMPHFFSFPSGGGEWLYHAEQMGAPIDWCVRIRAVSNADAQAKVRRKQRDLVGQLDQYDGEVTGAPPQLNEAIDAITEERSQLGANPAEPELQVSVLFSLADEALTGLEETATSIVSTFAPEEYGLARPTGGQMALLRSMLPGSTVAPVCKDYTQFMLARDLAAGAPFCGTETGDPQGLLLGVSLDSGTETPVLFDPAFGPKVNQSPSLAAVGRLGSGKSFFLKRLCMDTVARGGQVVTIDRSRRGEYVAFGEAIPGSAQVVRLEANADICLDPMRSFAGQERTNITLGFLSLLAGCSPHTEEGAALAEAVDLIAEREGSRATDVVDELERMGADMRKPDPAARALARRLAHYRRSAMGQIVFGDGDSVELDADFIVFWAPDLSLPDRQLLEAGTHMLLPEQVFAQALLYLVAAVGRRVVFRDPRRFAAALYDEAWALLASSHGQSLLVEGVRDGRKHNGAIWLASQHPNDFAISELADLLGARFVFDQAPQAVDAALQFLGVPGNDEAGVRLEAGLGTGQCLYRDVRSRMGFIQVLPPALSRYDAAFDTAPADGAVHSALPPASGSGSASASAQDRGPVSATSKRPTEALAPAEQPGGNGSATPALAPAPAPSAAVGGENVAGSHAGGGEPGEAPPEERALPADATDAEPRGQEVTAPEDAASEVRSRLRRQRRNRLAEALAGEGE